MYNVVSCYWWKCWSSVCMDSSIKEILGMIKIQELRIGNLVYGFDTVVSKKNKNIFTVESISENGINLWQVYGFDDEYAASVEPIKLTNEVLLKIGFEKISGRTNYLTLNISSDNNGNSINYFEDDGFYLEELFIGEDIFLHQLQNLYFALTGIELNTSGLI